VANAGGLAPSEATKTNVHPIPVYRDVDTKVLPGTHATKQNGNQGGGHDSGCTFQGNIRAPPAGRLTDSGERQYWMNQNACCH
jgi:hypothetical protein